MPFYEMRLMHAEIEQELDDAWRRVTSSHGYIGGPDVERFERDWAAYCGTRYAVGVANGTDALVLSLRALSIGPGDEVVVPAKTFVATAEGVLLAGAQPRFVDVDDDTLLMSPAAFEAAITPRTAAVVPVHLYGRMCEMDEITRIAQRHGIAVVEDAAQAHGATSAGGKAGAFGQAGCFSFYPAKNLGALGDGGAVVSDDAQFVETVRSMANHGRSADSWHHHDVLGTNSRLDSLQAAVLAVKLNRLDAWNESRVAAARSYTELLAGTECRVVGASSDSNSVHHLFVVRVRERDRIRESLSRKGIETGVHYPVAAHQHKPYRQFVDDELPVAERAAKEVLSLPMFPYIESGEVERVCEALREVA